MVWWGWALLVAGLAALVVGIRGISLAMRLDRLHTRVLASRDTLDQLLVRRAVLARDVAGCGSLRAPDAQELERAARACLEPADAGLVDDRLDTRHDPVHGYARGAAFAAERARRESELSRATRRALDAPARARLRRDAGGARLLDAYDMACYRVRLARSLHNQDVTQVRHLRALASVRVLHLAGRAAVPQYFDIDDETEPSERR